MKTLIFILISISLFTTVSWADEAIKRSADRLYKAAQSLAEQGVHHEAIDKYYQAIALRKDYRYYVALGQSQKTIKQEPLAFFSFRNALEALDKTSDERAGLLVLFVTTALNIGRLDDVRQYLPELKEKEPDLAKTAGFRLFCSEGELALKEGKYKRAYRLFKRARPLNLNDGRAISGCCLALKKLARAYNDRGMHLKRLHVLMLYYRLRPSKKVMKHIKVAFEKAGRPTRYKKAIKKLKPVK